MTCAGCFGACRCGGAYASAYGGARRPGRRPAPARVRPLGAFDDVLSLLSELARVLGVTQASDPIGRFGPVAITSGRTIQAPCSGMLDMCTDQDVIHWMSEAKSWAGYAAKLRQENVILAFGSDPAKWPPKAQLAERCYAKARDLLADYPGWLDSSKAKSYAVAMLFAKAALELYLQAVEESIGAKVDVGPNLRDDPILDPKSVPPYVPLPEFPRLFPSWGGIGFFALAALALWLYFRRRDGRA